MLKEIISGIKETINGQYRLIHEKGKYEGSIHFLIACTPDAYYKLQTHEETSLIFGGLGRRLNVITLPEINKKEGIEFLYGLLKYSYKNNIPEIFPIKNFGVFNLLLRISQSNLGVLTTLFTEVFKSIRDNGQIKVLDYENLLVALERQQIFVYGGQTPCIERETYTRIIRLLKDQRREELGMRYENIFKMLLGELKPFSIEELERRTKLGKKDVQNAISNINDQVRTQEKIEKVILKVTPLKKDKTLENDVLRAFDDYVEKDKIRNEKWIKIENYAEPLQDFKDRITHYSLERDTIVPIIYLPSDDSDVKLFFEGISEEKAREINNMLRKLRGDDVYYIASDAILFQIFPTPVPKGLEFITDRELRMKLWREVSRNLADQYDKFILQAFFTILRESDVFNLERVDESQKYTVAQLQDSRGDTTITTLFFAINGDIKRKDIEEINSVLKSKKKIHLAIPLYTGEITPDAQEKIRITELGKDGSYILLPDVRLHPTLVKRIICSYRSYTESKERVDIESFKAISREIITQELILDTKISEWLNEQEKRGVVIKINIAASKGLKEFSDSLNFFINFLDEENTPEEIFTKNVNQILKFRKFGTKSGFLSSDIASSSRMSELTLDLLNNGFLKAVDGKYKVITHPVETRILKILGKEQKLSEDELYDYFILKSTMKKILTDVFLNVLEYKGQVVRDKNFYKLNEPQEFYEEMEELYKQYKDELKKPEFKSYGHFYEMKEKGENLLIVNEFDSYISGLLRKIELLKNNSAERNIFLQQISLANRLLKQFNDEFGPSIIGAYREGKKLAEESKEKFSETESELRNITKNSQKWLRFDFELGNIREYKEMNEIVTKIEEEHKRIYTSEELNKIKDKLSDDKKKFKHDKPPIEAHYFNIKVFKIFTLHENLLKKIEDINKFVSRINPSFEELNSRESEFKSKLSIKEISERYQISNKVYENLKIYQIMEDIPAQTKSEIRLNEIRLNEIEAATKKVGSTILGRISNMINAIESVDGLLTKEKQFRTDLSGALGFKNKCDNILNTHEFETDIKKFGDELNSIEKNYGKRAGTLNLSKEADINKVINSLVVNLGDWVNSIKENKEAIEDRWREYKEKTEKRISRVREILKLISERHAIDTKELEQLMGRLLEKIKPSIDELNDKISSIENLMEEVRKQTYSTVKRFLSIDETQVLDVIFAKIDEGLAWIPLETIQDEAVKRHKLNHEKVDIALKNLTEKKYLKSGFSLSM